MSAPGATAGLRVAITGASGYIGTALCRRLRADSGVAFTRGLVRRVEKGGPLTAAGAEILVGDICDPAALAALVADVDVVVHAAAKLGRGRWSEFVATNVDAVRSIVDASVRAGVRRVVLLSSIEAYGMIRGEVNEDCVPRLCGHPYADSKLMGERAFWSTLRGTGTAGVLLRPGMVFGPESAFWTVRVIRAAIAGALEVYGRGEGRAMPIYIDDLIDGVLLSMTSPAAADGTFNFANTEDVTWQRWYGDYCAMVQSARVRRKSIVVARAKELVSRAFGRPRSRHLEVMTRTGRVLSRRAEALLGWRPRVGYEKGMAQTRRWLSEVGLIDERPEVVTC